MIAEGDLYQISTSADVAGLVGDVSAVWQWGDGTTSPATLQTNVPDGNVSIRLDYSRDDSGFFNDPQRRALLQAAADSIVNRFGDQLSAVNTQSPYVRWNPVISDPSTGNNVTLPANPTVSAGEIVIFAGARPLSGPQVGEGGPAGFAYQVLPYQFSSNAERQQIEAQIEADRQQIFGRGQTGALASPQTDVSLTHGSIAFDTTEASYHFGSPDDIETGEIDFFTVATHELAHALGFGTEITGVTTSWARLTANGSTFNGTSTTSVYQGSGNVPISASHWATSVRDTVGQETALTGSLLRGNSQPLSILDYAALDDLGWEVLAISATADGSHRFADDGTYTPALVMSGSRGGFRSINTSEVVVTNVAPTLSTTDTQTATVGRTLQIDNIVEIQDPGFRNLQSDPTTQETFTATIDWGDGTDIQNGSVTIDQIGTATGLPTIASIDASHTYQTAGERTIRVTVTDDDGGSAVGTVSISVFDAPSISIEIDNDSFAEDAGNDAATLTVRRTGSLSETLSVNLASSDVSEATLAPSAEFAIGQSELTVEIQAVDDLLLDGTQSVTFMASATNFDSQTVAVDVDDAEQVFGRADDVVVVENNANGVVIPIIRTNTDAGQAISFTITGGSENRATVTGAMQIDASVRNTSIRITPIDNSTDAFSILPLTYTITADGYQPSTFVVSILDDEKPVFQNQDDPFDTDGQSGVTPTDALLVINYIRRNGGNETLNPVTNPPRDDGKVDVNGDYRVTPVDALSIINAIRRRRNSGGGTSVTGESLSIDTQSAYAAAVDTVIAQVESGRRHPWHLGSSDDWLPLN